MTTATSSPADRGVETMHAWVQNTYGSPDVLSREAIPVPTAETGQLRVRVAAASVNARDWHIMRGEPKLARLLDRSVFRRKAPTAAIRGTDFAGTIDAVGSEVAGWSPGDRVFGEAVGTLAHYVVVAPETVARMSSLRTSVTVPYQDIGDASGGLGGDTSGPRLRWWPSMNPSIPVSVSRSRNGQRMRHVAR